MDQYHHGDLQASLLGLARTQLASGQLDGLSLRELARKAGVSATAVYHHFASKEALLAELARLELRELTTRWQGLGLRELGPAYLQFFCRSPALAHLIFHPRFRADRELADLQDQAYRHLRQGLDGHPEADGAALFIWALVHGLGQLYQAGVLGVAPADKPGYPELWYQAPEDLLDSLSPFIDRALAP